MMPKKLLVPGLILGFGAVRLFAQVTQSSTNVPLAIPDNGNVNSTLTYASSGTLADVNLTFSISHTWNDDIHIRLTSPSVAAQLLLRNCGGSSDNFTNTTIDQDAAGLMGCAFGDAPFTGSFLPTDGTAASPVAASGSMNAFDGTDPQGIWTLNVTDDSSICTGTLNAWSLTFTGTPPLPGELGTLPTVTTPTSASIAATTATLGGNATADGGSAITVRGVVYSETTTNNNPEIGGSGVTNAPAAGTGTGVFTAGVTGLTASTAYSFKAYATNVNGTTYTTVATFTTDAAPSADLAITKTDGVTTATPGGSTTYTITASNAGPNSTTGTVTDTFPASLTCTWTCSGAGGGTCSASGTGNISDSVTLPNGGSTTYTASCSISASASGSLANTATVAGVASDPTPGNNSATDTDTLAASADLAITKTDGVTTVAPGGSTTYTITASNAGPSNTTATVEDTFPASLTCTWTCAGSGGGTCGASGSGNINDSATLPSGGSATYTASCSISGSASGSLANTATITGSATDPTPGNNSATDTDTLTASADLSITKTDGVTTATPGNSTTYTITASNAGPSNTTATVEDTFPASLTCSWTCAGAGGGTCSASGSGNINDSVTLPSGGSTTYAASCSISAGASGSLSNTATVTGSATDPASGNNSATDTDTLTALADLSITKTDGVTTATPGNSTTYTITASNAGPSNTSATVADTFPASLTCSWTCAGAGGGTCSASGSGNINDSVTLPSGGSTTYTASCSISGSASGSLSNTATVTGSATDPTPGNNSATDTDTLTASADLSITKTDGVTLATPGGSTTYTITASNAGPSSTSATVADTFPASITCSWTCAGASGGTCSASGSGNINDSVTLPSGGSTTYTASCSISAGASGSLSNTATVTGVATDPTPGNNSATDTDSLATVPGAPTIGTVTAGNSTVSVTFTAPVSNGGSPITGYTATCGAQSVSGTVSPIVVTGVTNGTPVTCTVVATNIVGNSAPSTASNSVTPQSVSLSINDVAMAEGNSGTSLMVFTVSMNAASSVAVTVGYATLDGTAIAGSDYTSTSGTLTFAPSETSKTVSVSILGDVTLESNESVGVMLSGSTRSTIARAIGRGNIQNDEPSTAVSRPQPSGQEFFAVDIRETPMVGDFDGDLKTDVVTFGRQNPSALGDVYVALSNGVAFGENMKWHDNFAARTDEVVVVGDYNGDGKDDVATWLRGTSREVYVALSTGSGLLPESVWANSLGVNRADPLFSGDVDGDGKDDLIRFAQVEGKVYVSLSNATAFGSATVWHGQFSITPREKPLVADVNGDGKDDIATFTSDSPAAYGDVYVAFSDGTQFVGPTGLVNDSAKWADMFSPGAAEQVRAGDVNGDGKDDFVTFLPPPFAQGYVGLSLGTSLADSVLWGEAVAPLLGAGDSVFLGDVNGDGKADLIIFAQKEGRVFVSLAS